MAGKLNWSYEQYSICGQIFRRIVKNIGLNNELYKSLRELGILNRPIQNFERESTLGGGLMEKLMVMYHL